VVPEQNIPGEEARSAFCTVKYLIQRERHYIFTSGQVPLDPETGAIVGTTIEEQTEQALKNVKAILEEAGSSMENVLKTTVFIKNMNDFAAMNAVYATYFTEGSFPSRSAVEVARLPKDVLVEIETIAYL